MRKVLIITYYWPPSGGGGVQRWLKFSKYFSELGWEPIIYTPENPEYPALDENLLSEIPENMKVVKTRIWEPYGLYKKFTNRKKDAKIATGFTSEKGELSSAEKASRWVRGNLFIPDARKYWIKPSARFLKNFLAENEIKTVITTGPPHSMHLIGLKLKKSSGVSWVADFRDPWTNIDYIDELRLTTNSSAKHDLLETEVLKSADIVVTIGGQMKKEFSQKVNSHKIHVIPNGFDEADFNGEKSDLDQKFTLAHIGSFSPARNIKSFWQAVSECAYEDDSFKQNLEIKLVGAVDASVIETAKNFSLEENLVLISYVPHNEVVKITSSAQVLCLFVNKTRNAEGIITGKIFEYLKSERPILAIGPKTGDLAKILKSVQADEILDYDELSDIKVRLKTLFQQWKDHKLQRKYSSLSQYERENLAKTYVALLEEI